MTTLAFKTSDSAQAVLWQMVDEPTPPLAPMNA